jgi:hypothetical protein
LLSRSRVGRPPLPLSRRDTPARCARAAPGLRATASQSAGPQGASARSAHPCPRSSRRSPR